MSFWALFVGDAAHSLPLLVPAVRSSPPRCSFLPSHSLVPLSAPASSFPSSDRPLLLLLLLVQQSSSSSWLLPLSRCPCRCRGVPTELVPSWRCSCRPIMAVVFSWLLLLVGGCGCVGCGHRVVESVSKLINNEYIS